MDFKMHFERAWKLTFSFIVPLLLLTLVMVGVSFLSLGILAPVTLAGYFHSLLLLVRQGREPRVQDVFSQMRLFWPLLGFSILFLLAASIGFDRQGKDCGSSRGLCDLHGLEFHRQFPVHSLAADPAPGHYISGFRV